MLLDAAASERIGSLLELAVLTGLRRGALLGLRWSDVELDRGVLHVRQQVVQDVADTDPCPGCGGVHRGLRFGPPKTRGSEGRVDPDGRAVGALLAHQLSQESERAVWGKLYADHDLVFARENGKPYDPADVTRGFKRIATEAGLGNMWLHAFGRHGHANLLPASGVDIAVVSKRLPAQQHRGHVRQLRAPRTCWKVSDVRQRRRSPSPTSTASSCGRACLSICGPSSRSWASHGWRGRSWTAMLAL